MVHMSNHISGLGVFSHQSGLSPAFSQRHPYAAKSCTVARHTILASLKTSGPKTDGQPSMSVQSSKARAVRNRLSVTAAVLAPERMLMAQEYSTESASEHEDSIGRAARSQSHTTAQASGATRRRRPSTAAKNVQSLLLIPGIGPKNEARFLGQGVRTIDDLRAVHFGNNKANANETKKFLQDVVGIRNKSHINSILTFLQQKDACSNDSSLGTKVTLSVEGNIGAGKSTFLNILASQGVPLQVVPEPVEKWQSVGDAGINLLSEFYNDPKRLAYTFQNYVFLTRMVQERDSYMSTRIGRLLERSVFSDRMVFVRAVHAAKHIDDTELAIYDSWFDPVLNTLPTLVPNGFIYLKAEPKVCFRRLRKRARQEEVGVKEDYLEELHSNHEDWLFEGGDPVTTGSQGYLYIPQTNQTLLNPSLSGRHPLTDAPPPDAPTVSSMKLLDPVKFYIPPVPSELKSSLRILDQKKGKHMHPKLHQVPALILDCNDDIDLDRDEDYKRHIAQQVQLYTEYVKQFQAAKLQAIYHKTGCTSSSTPFNGLYMQDDNGNTTYVHSSGIVLPNGMPSSTFTRIDVNAHASSMSPAASASNVQSGSSSGDSVHVLHITEH